MIDAAGGVGQFTSALRAATITRSAAHPAASNAVKRCLANLDLLGVSQSSPSWLPACESLATAVSRVITTTTSDLRELGRAIGDLAPHLGWYRRTGLATGPEFADGHANAIVVGPGGLVERNDVMIGFTVMAPDVLYADHHHPPEEVYLVLSPGSWRQTDGPWHEPGIGGIVYNPPDVVHSMRSGPDPLLAVWMLPGAI